MVLRSGRSFSKRMGLSIPGTVCTTDSLLGTALGCQLLNLRQSYQIVDGRAYCFCGAEVSDGRSDWFCVEEVVDVGVD